MAAVERHLVHRGLARSEQTRLRHGSPSRACSASSSHVFFVKKPSSRGSSSSTPGKPAMIATTSARCWVRSSRARCWIGRRRAQQQPRRGVRATVRRAQHHETATLARADLLPQLGPVPDHAPGHQPTHAVREDADRLFRAGQRLLDLARQKLGRVVDRLAPVVGKRDDLVGVRQVVAQRR